MKIDCLRISNWRSIKQLSINFQDLMIFIGQNNHGKSNVLSAILFFFGEIKLQDLDFHRGESELYIDVTFKELDDADKTTFKKYLSNDGTIRVRKTAYTNGNFDYKGFLQNPVETWLQEENASSYTKREVAESLPIHPYLEATGRLTKQDIIDAQRRYMQSNAVQYNYELESTNFMGLKSVAKGIFGDVYFVPAVKDSADDFSTKEASAFGKLYAGIIEKMSASNSEWNATKDKLSSLFGTLNRRDATGQQNSLRPTQLTEFESALSDELISWGAEIDVEVIAPNIDDVFRANTQVWIDDGMRTDIRRKGHGLQRALTFALIKVVSDKAKRDREIEAAATTSTTTRTASSSTFFILEEPELYLHPQAQRSLFETLTKLSESNNQVMLCTHASALIELERYKSICIVKKDSEAAGTEICQCTSEIFVGDDKKDFNLSYWINPDRSELFFAKRVLLLEGATDKTCIPLLARRLNVFRHDYTLIDCGSKSSIPLYAQLLNKFRIPYIAVYDKDHQSSKDAQAIGAADRASRAIENVLDAAIATSIIFGNDIEEELGMPPGNDSKPYMALKHIEDAGFAISTGLEQKIRLMYA